MSYSLLEVTLKERIHPKLWLAEFHPTSAWHGKRLYTLLLSAVCLLDMKGFELFHWKFQDDFLWEILRAFVSYDWTPVIIGGTCILVRYIRSLCGTGAPINGLILDELPWLRWRFFKAYILVGTILFVCWFVVLLFTLVYRPQFINVTSLLLSGFFNLTAFFFSLLFFAYWNVGSTPLFIFRMSLIFYSNHIC